MATITYREALNQALSEEIARDENVVLLGEEVAQFKGSIKFRRVCWISLAPPESLIRPLVNLLSLGLRLERP